MSVDQQFNGGEIERGANGRLAQTRVSEIDAWLKKKNAGWQYPAEETCSVVPAKGSGAAAAEATPAH